MEQFTPTRSLALALADERRTMREGHAFLDEKCLLLAGQMLRDLKRWQQLRREFAAAWRLAQQALRAAIARHGLHGLQLYPAPPLQAPVLTGQRMLLGVTMQSAQLGAAAARPTPPAAAPSPEAQACRGAFAALLPQLAEMAALSGNLARLYAEYRRTVRRVRALQDVLLPEVERTLAAIETSLEELEQDEAAMLRRVATGGSPVSAG